MNSTSKFDYQRNGIVIGTRVMSGIKKIHEDFPHE